MKFNAHITTHYTQIGNHFGHYFFIVGAFIVPQKFCHHSLNDCHACNSISLSFSSNFSSDINFLISGPTKIPSFILASDKDEKTECRYLKPSPSLFKAFTNCFIIPNLMCNGGSKTFSLGTKLCLSTFLNPGVSSVLRVHSFLVQ